MTRASCKYCRYRRPITPTHPQETICHYMLDTGVSRGCPPEDCCHWQPVDNFSPGWNSLMATLRKEAKK